MHPSTLPAKTNEPKFHSPSIHTDEEEESVGAWKGTGKGDFGLPRRKGKTPKTQNPAPTAAGSSAHSWAPPSQLPATQPRPPPASVMVVHTAPGSKIGRVRAGLGWAGPGRRVCVCVCSSCTLLFTG